MRVAPVVAVAAVVFFVAPVWGASATNSDCRVALSAADARALAAATPNARAFVENYGAKLSTAVQSERNGAALVSVKAEDPKHGETEVGVYTVSLRTGHVTDDDMEPAEDAQTAAVRGKLIARRCAEK